MWVTLHPATRTPRQVFTARLANPDLLPVTYPLAVSKYADALLMLDERRQLAKLPV